MVDAMKLYLKSMGPINEANVNINKITIVGGYNSTGKSTLSKFLYSFLRSNTINRQEITYKRIVELIKELSRYLEMYLAQHTINHDFINPEVFDLKKYDFDKILEFYVKMKSSFYHVNVFNDEETYFSYDGDFDKIDELIYIVNKNEHELYVSLMRCLLNSEFSSTEFNSMIKINDYNNLFEFEIDFKNHDFNDDNAFKSKSHLLLNNVYYIDSISVLDVFERGRLLNRKSDHLEFLRKNLAVNSNASQDIFDNQINNDIIELQKEIDDIIKGKFIYESGEFKFISNTDVKSNVFNTASGTKQIGLIQLLLSNRKLTENSFLIIDEPEVNLHPNWQFKFAKILVLISKKLNVSIYINTHSPLFIESIHTYAEYYDLLDKTSYHLAKSSENNLYDIGEVDEKNLVEIYDNLGQPYFDMDVLRLEKEFD